jgi:hypothetical protein
VFDYNYQQNHTEKEYKTFPTFEIVILGSIDFIVPANGAELSSAPMMIIFDGRFPRPIPNLKMLHPRRLLQQLVILLFNLLTNYQWQFNFLPTTITYLHIKILISFFLMIICYHCCLFDMYF